MEIKSVWKTNKDLPDIERKIEVVITKNVIEVDVFKGVNKPIAERYWWSSVKLWRYL